MASDPVLLPPNAAILPTMIVVHEKENRRKCSVEPLRKRSDFLFRWFPSSAEPIPHGYVRLGFGGPILTPQDREIGLLVLDATWRYAERMETRYQHVPVRSLPRYHTAYPRVSSSYPDPLGGLATIEAIYAAFHLIGRPTAGLLDHYHWKNEFLRRNGFIEDIADWHVPR